MKGRGRWWGKEIVCRVSGSITHAGGLTHIHAFMSGGPGEDREGPCRGQEGEGADWPRVFAKVGERGS